MIMARNVAMRLEVAVHQRATTMAHAAGHLINDAPIGRGVVIDAPLKDRGCGSSEEGDGGQASPR
jgi:hypothetical protein